MKRERNGVHRGGVVPESLYGLGLPLETEVALALYRPMMQVPECPGLVGVVALLLGKGVPEDLVRDTYEGLRAALPQLTLLAAAHPAPTWEEVRRRAEEHQDSPRHRAAPPVPGIPLRGASPPRVRV